MHSNIFNSKMFSVSEISSTSFFSFYSQIAMIIGLIQFYQFYIDRYLPARFKVYLLSLFENLFNPHSSSDLTLIIEEFEGFTFNELYESSGTYLGTKTDPSVDRLKVRKAAREKSLSATIAKGQEVTDIFQGIKLKWNLVISENSTASSGNPQYDSNHYKPERRFFELSFEKKYKDQVLSLYLPHVVEKAKALKAENNVVKLYSLGIMYGGDMEGGQWGSVNLDHPSNFDTLALDSDVKTELINDLDRFLKRRDYYKKVGKVWKRGYLLYGPPGTGKSSLVAAMANYLKFDIYDLELTSIASDSQLRSLLVSTKNRSILVIEDIDCGAKIQDREYEDEYIYNSNQFSLSGLLNFVDGLWSSCGDERIIIFTTNHKDKIDPALLRPGRMDMHIHMSYCTFFGFKLLASNYLGIQDDHPLFEQIKELLGNVKVTPAEIAEELMKRDDSEVALECLVQFLMRKTTQENATLDEEKEVDYDRELANENKDTVASNDMQTLRRPTVSGGRGSWQGRGRPMMYTRGRGAWLR